MLVDLRNCYKQAEPASSAVHIERMETMEDFEREEQRLCDAQAFDTLVGFISLEAMDTLHYVIECIYLGLLPTGAADCKNRRKEHQGLCPQSP